MPGKYSPRHSCEWLNAVTIAQAGTYIQKPWISATSMPGTILTRHATRPGSAFTAAAFTAVLLRKAALQLTADRRTSDSKRNEYDAGDSDDHSNNVSRCRYTITTSVEITDKDHPDIYCE